MFIINEYQTTGNTTAIVTPEVRETIEEAESVFYTKMSFAAISSVEKHAVTLTSDEGFVLKTGCYKH